MGKYSDLAYTGHVRGIIAAICPVLEVLVGHACIFIVDQPAT